MKLCSRNGLGEKFQHPIRSPSLQKIINALYVGGFRDVKEPYLRSALKQFARDSPARQANALIGSDIGVEDNVNRSALPTKAVKVADRAFHIEPLSVWPTGFADGAAPAPDTRDRNRKKPETKFFVVSESGKGERL